ncbi:unnamed protein product [Effrenium voratum]|nr:unnamed protein product [Effrenium voratum]
MYQGVRVQHRYQGPTVPLAVQQPVLQVHTRLPVRNPSYPATHVLERRISSELARQGWEAVHRTAMEVMNTPVPTFQCKICLENLPLSDQVVFQDCGNPEHGCCRDCTRYWIEGLINCGQVHSITCGRRGDVDCSARARNEEIRPLTDEDSFKKFQRFMQMREDKTVRECPQCAQMCKPATVGGEICPEMVCPSCQCTFCYYHSAAHAGRPCDEYSRQISKQLKEMANGVLADSKQCPKCGVHTVKTSGCNHMTCAERTCKAHWCWVCGREIEGGANGVFDHYTAGIHKHRTRMDAVTRHFVDVYVFSPGSCRQFSDTTTPGCALNILRFLTVPFRLVFMLTALVLFVVSLALAPITGLFLLLSLLCCQCRNNVLKSQTVVKAIMLMPGFLIYVGIAFVWILLVATVLVVLLTLWPLCRCFLPRMEDDACGFDHTHVIWLMTLPFTALEPGRCLIQCYFRKWSCCRRQGESDSDTDTDRESDSQEVPDVEAEDDSDRS